MKKSTLVLVVIALALGGFVYFGEVKGGLKASPPKEASQPVFSMVTAGELTSLTLDHGGQQTKIEKQGKLWEITQPIQTRADQKSVGAIVEDVANAQVTRKLAASANGLSEYGLAKPGDAVDFRLKDGKEHRIDLGAKDFTGDSVYAQVDGSKQVELLSASLLSDAEKPLAELRDRSVLDVTNPEIVQFDLKNRSGEIVATKKDSKWRLEKPRAVAADAGAVDALLDAVAGGKMDGIVSESAKDLAAYGLNHPQIEFQARDTGGSDHTLLVGRKVGEDFYARDTSRPMVFRIKAKLDDSLSEKFFDLRNKTIEQFDSTKLKTVTVRNPNQTVVCEQKSPGKWVLEQPTSHKGGEVQSWRFLEPLETAQATAIYDSAPSGVEARLDKPSIEVTLVDQSGKTTTIRISAPVDKSVYAQSSAGPTVYKFRETDIDNLNFKLSDLML